MKSGKRNQIMIVLTLAGMFFGPISYAQENYLPGFIISLEGDTIRGTIDYRAWENSPRKIAFRRDSGGDEATHTPTTIKAFGVRDEIYQAAAVQTEVGPGATLEFISETVFLRTMIAGKKSLYLYENQDGTKRFYIGSNLTYELLLYNAYQKEAADGRMVLAENKKFIGQLALYLQDCPDIQSRLNRLAYTEVSLEKLFAFYFECTHSEQTFQKKTDKTTVEGGILSGVSITSVQFSGDETAYDYLIDVTFPQSTGFTGGMFLNIVFPGNQKKFSFYNDLVYTSFHTEGTYHSKGTAGTPSATNVTYSKIGGQYLKVNTMLRFRIPLASQSLFFNGGLTNGYMISETNYKRKETTYTLSGTTTVAEGQAMGPTRRFEQGYVLGLGFGIGKFSVEGRYEKTNGLSSVTNLKATLTRYYVYLGYRF